MCSYFWILLLWRGERCWLQGINVTQSGNQSSPGITAEAARLILCLMQFKHLSWPVHARVEASWGSSSFYFSWEVIYGRAIMCSWRFLPIWSPGPGQQTKLRLTHLQGWMDGGFFSPWSSPLVTGAASPHRRSLSSSTALVSWSVLVTGLLCAVLASRGPTQSSEVTNPPVSDGAVLLSLQMTEGRHCQVHLLDDRNLELLVQVKIPLLWALVVWPGPGQTDFYSALIVPM